MTEDDDDTRTEARAFLEQSIDAAVTERAAFDRQAAEAREAESAAQGAIVCRQLRNDLVHVLGTSLLAALEASCDLVLRADDGPADPGQRRAVALFNYGGKMFRLWHLYNRTTERSSWMLQKRGGNPTSWGALADDDGWRDDVFASELLLFLATQRPKGEGA